MLPLRVAATADEADHPLEGEDGIPTCALYLRIRLGEKFDGGAQHRSVNTRIARSAKIYNHYETQGNISRRDRRRSP